MPSSPSDLIRGRGTETAVKVSNAELFFDLVYVFAITQVSHFLLGSLTPLGFVQATVLWFSVWLGWQYACWFTNWFNPEAVWVRLCLFGTMLGAMVMAVAIPHAFAEHGLLFATCFAAIQVGKALAAVLILEPDDPLRRNYQRILGWSAIAAVFWIAGGLASPEVRLPLWGVAFLCEYVSPMFGFPLPGLGRSKTTDWTISGGHLAERCQLIVIVALGEGIVVSGATLAKAGVQEVPVLIAFIVAFLGNVATWWLYFDTASSAAAHTIEHAEDPGRMGAAFHYFHVAIVGAIVVLAVGNDLSIDHPAHHIELPAALVLIGGPTLYLLANGFFKRLVYGRFPLSHLVGLGLLGALWFPAFFTDNLMVAGLTTVILVVAAVWERRSRLSRLRTVGGKA